MYEHPFTIKEVAWLLSIRCLEGGSDQEFPVECPYCGDTRGKCSFCISKNGEIKNVFHCFHCGQGGNMLTLYADIMGLYGEDRCKTAYQEIINRLENGGQVTGSTYKKITCRYKRTRLKDPQNTWTLCTVRCFPFCSFTPCINRT